MPRRALFFDFDGTLINSMPQHAQIFGGLLSDAYGLDAAQAGRDYLSMAGVPLETQFRHALANGGVLEPDFEALLAEFWVRYSTLEPVLFPDVAEVLPRLAAEYPLVVTTQGRQKMVEAKLGHLGLASHFALILGVDPERPELGKGEPHFSIARAVLSLTPADMAASVMTGDGAFDMQVARQAGMTAVGRLTGDNTGAMRDAGAHFVVEDLYGLESILRSDAD